LCAVVALPIGSFASKCGYAFWVAAWSPEPGKKKQARFSVGKWGEKEAEQKAREERAARAAELLEKGTTR
jgi:hypothetical protein